MKWMKWSVLMLVMAVVLSFGNYVMAEEAAKTISGKSSCGGCSGIVQGCCVMLTDNDGVRWVLRGDSKTLKAAFKARKSGKTMTATMAGEPATKKGDDGKEYKEVKVSGVKVGS